MLHLQSPPSSTSQNSQYMNPLQAPQQGPLWKDLPISRAFFDMSLEFLNRISSDKKNLTLLLKVLGKEPPTHVPQNVALMVTDAHLHSLPLHILHGPQ